MSNGISLLYLRIHLGSGPSSRRGSLFDDSRRPSLLINEEVSIAVINCLTTGNFHHYGINIYEIDIKTKIVEFLSSLAF
jgi:hypothetical protein